MRTELANIIKEHIKFKEYIDNLDLSIYEDCSKEDLKKFVNEIYNSESQRHIILEAYKIIQSKKSS